MIQRKSKFLTFCFSLMPGAGHMYLGFMKQGCSIMLLFFGICASGFLFRTSLLLLFTPVIWFYSFFDALNKNSMNDHDFYQLEDRYICNLDLSELQIILQGKFRLIIAAVFILLGCSTLFSYFTSFLRNILPDEIYWSIINLFRQMPRFILAVFIILVGIHLICGKKIELYKKEIFSDDSSEKEEDTLN